MNQAPMNQALSESGSQYLTSGLFLAVVAGTIAITVGQPQHEGGGRLLRRRSQHLPASRTVWPSPATT